MHPVLKYFASLFISDLSDIFDVTSELSPIAANWKSVGAALQVKFDVLESIDTRCTGNPRACLSGMVKEWLKRNYNVEKYGEPTWQRLVEVVVHPAGGANSALARDISRRHKAGGRLSGYVSFRLISVLYVAIFTCVCILSHESTCQTMLLFSLQY